ncbi:MAG: hypothetical protein AB2L14_08710 [Candidatus Xenobiia bacterium LiM19]
MNRSMTDLIAVFFEKSVERDRIVHEMPNLLKAVAESPDSASSPSSF